MKKLIVAIIAVMSITTCAPAPVYANEKRCTGMNDTSFKCASFLGSEVFLDLASSADTVKLSANACVEVIKDQIDPTANGKETFNDGVNTVTVTVDNKTVKCEGKGM